VADPCAAGDRPRDRQSQTATFGTAIERSPAISNTGQIVFSNLAENVDAWRVKLDPNTGMASGALERLTDDAAQDMVMNVSADGRTLAIVSWRTKRNEVWLKDVETGSERQLTFAGGGTARVAPDGSRVAVQRQVSGGTRVELYETSTSRSTTLCDECLLNGGGWSSDGTRLLISRGFPARQRPVVMEVESRREQELTAPAAWNIFQAHYSADNRWVTFHTANTPDLRQVYVVPAFLKTPVGPDAWVPVAADFGIYPIWSPDAAAVYYFSLRDGYMCAWLQPLDRESKRPVGPPRAVQHFHQPRLRAAARTNPTNDVNEHFMYVTLTETTGNIWMLDTNPR